MLAGSKNVMALAGMLLAAATGVASAQPAPTGLAPDDGPLTPSVPPAGKPSPGRPDRPAPPRPDKAPTADGMPTAADLLAKLHHVNMMEIEMGALARERGASQEMRKLGETLIRDHSDADRKIFEYARRADIRLPDHPVSTEADEETSRMQKVRALKGVEFDRAFADMTVVGHEKTLKLVNDARASVRDVELNDLLGKLLPALKAHLRTATGLRGTPLAASAAGARASR